MVQQLIRHPGAEMEPRLCRQKPALRPDASNECVGDEQNKAAEVETAMEKVDEAKE